MGTKTVSTRIEPLIFLYDTHTALFPNVIVGISNENAQNRLHTKANHVAWLTGSLVQQRVEIGRILGADVRQAADELFRDYKGIQDNVNYPTLESFKEDWDKISPVTREALLNVEDEKLNSIFQMDGMSMPHFDLIAYSVHREAYLFGQIGLWRRLLGYEAMKYPGM